ncbi:hydrogenase maturation nickel metallochaperone HypA [Desulforhopalus singaporensis]|uniref:Hydrogenase maturation factor HypA n=1 Tax=Desulforhopalus singaporensis TaxID=91360 RepID=A0A1H0TXV5_9BACT|nr:hydrogenase maturation nickel metallochaperone HypA [Desulforhopalus singaporensis]SDP58610.1 hydrogenase nickel incorporation protein HypA/HybF [Desulforhopalus singaporensis]
MHELPVTEKILETALAHAEQHGLSRIHSITLKIGELTDLEDRWLNHYFDYLSKDTIAAGAHLVVIRVPIVLKCNVCQTRCETTKEKMADEKCPHCGAEQRFSILSGREYFIEEMAAK